MFNLPLNSKPYYNSDPIANVSAPFDNMDCYLEPVPDGGFVTRRRPGMVEFCDLGTAAQGDGGFYWDAAGKAIVVSGGKTFELFEDGTFADLTTATLQSGVPVTFADGRLYANPAWLYLANGNLVYLNGGNTTAPTDANTPAATHVAWINSRFIANESGSNKFDFTSTNPATSLLENDYWSDPSNPLSCDARGDNLAALFTAWQEIYSWGQEGLEIWQDDGVTPFSPLPGAFAEAGLEAPYSVVRSDNTIFALCVIDSKRCVVKLQGRAPSVVSEPIARILSDMETVSDAIGDIIAVGGMAIYLLTFPTANQTWAYDYKNDTWVRWGYWSDINGIYDRFLGQHAFFVKPWNKHLIMSRIDGKIYELSRDAFDDAGRTMNTVRHTIWIDHNEVWKRKKANEFYVKAKSGGTDTASLLVSWLDNGSLEYSSEMALDFNPIGNYDFLSKNNRFGMYRSRKYRFRWTDNSDLVLVGATEGIEVLRN